MTRAPSFLQIRKENLTAPSAWAGQGFHTAKQQLPTSNPSASLEIFTDEEFLNEETAPASSAPSTIPFGSHPEPAPTRRALGPAVGFPGPALVPGTKPAAPGNQSCISSQTQPGVGPQPSTSENLSTQKDASVSVHPTQASAALVPTDVASSGAGSQNASLAARDVASSAAAPTSNPDCSFKAELLELPGGEEVSYTELRALAWQLKHRSSSSGSSSSRKDGNADLSPAGSSMPVPTLSAGPPFVQQQQQSLPLSSGPVKTNLNSGSNLTADSAHDIKKDQLNIQTSKPLSDQVGGLQARTSFSQIPVQPQVLGSRGTVIPVHSELAQLVPHSVARSDRGTHQPQGSCAVQSLPPAQLQPAVPQQTHANFTPCHPLASVVIPAVQPSSSNTSSAAEPSTPHGVPARPAQTATPQHTLIPAKPPPKPVTQSHPLVHLPQRAPLVQQPSVPFHAQPPPVHHSMPPQAQPATTHVPATQRQPAPHSIHQPQQHITPSYAQPLQRHQLVQQVMPPHAPAAIQPRFAPIQAQPVAQQTMPPHTQAAPPHAVPARTQQPVPHHVMPTCTQPHVPQHIMPSHTPMRASADATSAPAPEPTITMSTKAAFDALNDMFSDELPHGGGGGHASSAHQQQRKRVIEPTVTLNTQAAFEALNDMFSDDLPHQQVESVGGGGSTQRGKVRFERVCGGN